MEADHGVTLLSLSPENKWEFLVAMSEAWAWTQARKRFYCDTGGEMNIEDYLADARLPVKKQIGIIENGALISIVTVKAVAEKIFEVHVTSPRGVRFETVLSALEVVRDGLFHDLGAECVYTTCPVYNGHEHKGSRLLAEACGMTATGCDWNDEAADGTQVYWREYAIDRKTFYGRTKSNIRERIQVLPKTFVAGTGRLEEVESAS